MTQTYYTDRSRTVTYQRCRRMRFLEYHAGAEGRGLVPVRKSIHLVVGGAVHAGMEVLLKEGQAAVDLAAGSTLEEQLAVIFDQVGEDGKTVARAIEDRAVAAALADFDKEYGIGVELDADEAAAARVGNVAQMTGTDVLLGQLRGSLKEQDSPIIIDFSDFGPAK